MRFSDFEKRVVKVKKMELPGEELHFRMAPLERLRELKRQAQQMKSAKQAAVMCLFYPSQEGETQFMLILRKTYHGVHSNQIGFPGGKVEKEDADLMETALRETHEEVGVPPDAIDVLKELTEVYIPPSNYVVKPFMGVVRETPYFSLQEEEVEAMIEVSLKELLDDTSRITKNLSTSYAQNIEVPAFHLRGHVVWGATAMMLNEVHALLQELLE